MSIQLKEMTPPKQIDVGLFPSQIKMITADEKNIVAVLSRSYGKSYSLAFWCLYRLMKESTTGMIICPTYSMLRETVKYLLMHADTLGLEWTLNKSPRWCNSYLSDHKNIFSINMNDGRHYYIQLCSADNADSVRGKSADFIAYDECALLNEEIVDIATPCLRGKGPSFKYRQLFCTTPRDTSNWLYKRYVAIDRADTLHIHASAIENYIEFNRDKLEYYKSILTNIMWKREILAEWVDLSSNSMFYAFDAHHIETVQKPSGFLWITCDQNCIDLQTLCGYKDKDIVYVDHEINIPEAGSALKVIEKFHAKYSSGTIRQVYMYGDRYGNNNSVVSQSTYYHQMRKALEAKGWTVINKVNTSNPSVRDSTELVNRQFEHNKIKISPSCKEFIRHLKDVRWKDNEFVMNKKLLDSGFCDAIRYLIFKEFNKGGGLSAGAW